MEKIISKIKEKRELRGLPNYLIRDEIKKQLKSKKNGEINLSIKEEKILIKSVRANLRKISGGFYLNKKIPFNNVSYDELLKYHRSSNERIPHYNILKNIIAKENPKIILDIGCGLNPIAIADKKIIYYACDIDKTNISIIRRFFKFKKINGRAFICDLTKKIPKIKSDICLAMKVFDVIEKRGHKLAEKIIKEINVKTFIVSFSTRTISGKPMNHPQRGWIERMSERLGYNWDMIKTDNEIFYIIKKN